MTFDWGFSAKAKSSEVRNERKASTTVELGSAWDNIKASISPDSSRSIASICSDDSGTTPMTGCPMVCSSLLGSLTTPVMKAKSWHTTNPMAMPKSAAIATVKGLLGRAGFSGTTAGSTTATLPTVPALAICNCWALFSKLT